MGTGRRCELELQQATALARDLVARYGLSDAVGPVPLLAPDIGVHLDGSCAADRPAARCSTLDEEVRRTVEDAAAAGEELLRRRSNVIDALLRT